MKYKRRAYEIEAFQLTKNNRWDPTTWPPWLVEAWKKPNEEVGSVYPTPTEGDSGMTIRMLHREERVAFKDWIVHDLGGALFRHFPEIFEKTYEPIDPEPTVGMPTSDL